MAKSIKRNKDAILLRSFRKIHRWTGILLFVFFFIMAITSILLGWKKHSFGWVQAKTHTGTSTDLSQWLPVDSLHKLAIGYLHDSVDASLSTSLDRIDARADKGIVKFVFKDHFWGLQLDGATGKLLFKERRRADFIEKIHDGSILDFYANTPDDYFKLAYTSIMSIALLLFTVTGFWLWYGPKRFRKKRRS